MCETQSGTLSTCVCAHEEARSQPRVLLSRSYSLCLLRRGPSLWPWSSSVRLDWLASSQRGSHLSLSSQSMQVLCVHINTPGLFTRALCIKLGFYTWSASTFLTSCLFSPSLPKNALVFDHAIMDMVSSKRFCLVPKPGLPTMYFPHLQTSTHKNVRGKTFFLSLELKLWGENLNCDLRGKICNRMYFFFLHNF